ncbi:transposase family protein [Streptomyces fulvoviolaceus]|uniref:transposase family protein n=1 Tax=Streptomyces fulvoviolaceus TaxID=285535 RepID=UPI000D115861
MGADPDSYKIFVAVDRSGWAVTSLCSNGMLPVCDDVLKLLPQLSAVELGSVEESGEVVVISARSRAGPAACTGCGRISDWEHSRYVRHVADEAVGGRAVRIDLSVRRLYCENPACPKTTFAEQVDGLTVRYQRRTCLD